MDAKIASRSHSILGEESSCDGRRRLLQLRLLSRLRRVVEYIIQRFFESFDVVYARNDVVDDGDKIIRVGVPMNLSKNVQDDRLRDVHGRRDSV